MARDKMKFFNSAIERKLIDKEGNSNNVLFLPAFNGLVHLLIRI